MRRHLRALKSHARRAAAFRRPAAPVAAVEIGEALATQVAGQAIAQARVFGECGTSAVATHGPRLPVVICLWDRLDRLPRTLRSLAHSVGVRADVYLWNNREAAAGRVLRDVEAACASGPEGLSVTVATSAVNIGGFGRFYWARQLAPRHPFVVFLDDDQMLDAFSLAELAADARPREMRAVWAYRFENRTQYWLRAQVRPGERAHYLGTGGMITDTGVFQDDGVFGCPSRYWFIEDLWLSYYTRVELGWALRRSRAEIGMIFDGRNQYRALRQAKDDFFRLLAQDRRWLVDDSAGGSGDDRGAGLGEEWAERLIPAPRRVGAPPGRY